MRRVILDFANTKVEFADRELAIKQVEEWADKGTYPVQVIYGPEGCGKTAWLLQSVELLKELGFEVIYVNPINKFTIAEFGIEGLRNRFLKLVEEAISQNVLARIAWIAYDTAYELVKVTRGRVAIIVDDAFQVIGVKESAMYVKALLNLIEYPPEHYERIITIAATSEGSSRFEVGKHRWANTLAMWNLGKEGFKQLYEQVPGSKPSLDEAWKLTGGNPGILEELYRANWDVDKVIDRLIEGKRLMAFITSLNPSERELIMRALDDPDILMSGKGIPLLNRLIELNLALDIPSRKPYLWVDEPPPERDLELGIGRYVAWQSPLHREAVKRALEAPRQ
ncbi:hypothetical protein JCM16161A_21910 [Vulcanisaeta sp. JCM 16161]|uniref:ATP-binding protein n=1 Tax=Vulcanisaeta sp. JCM 16161 TaxID=1295372 RepID=UPI00406C0CE8